jgi:transcriptional regulator of acetoin/glycerol metabolism
MKGVPMIPETDLHTLKSLSRAARGGTLDTQHLAERAYEMGSSACHEAIRLSLVLPETLKLSELEKAALQKAIQVSGGKIPVAAALLGIGKTTAYRKAKQYGLLTSPAFCPKCGRRMPQPTPQLETAA